MSTKIFPHRRYNPNKGSAVIGLPDPPLPSREDRRVMRELLAEERARQRAKRAAALPPPVVKPEPVPVTVWGFLPEQVVAFADWASRYDRRRASPAKRRALVAAVDFLRRFRAGEPAACEICKADITTTHVGSHDYAPYGVFVFDTAGVIQASGLCYRCTRGVGGIDTYGETKDGEPCKITLKEWMVVPPLLEKEP